MVKVFSRGSIKVRYLVSQVEELYIFNKLSSVISLAWYFNCTYSPRDEFKQLNKKLSISFSNANN